MNDARRYLACFLRYTTKNVFYHVTNRSSSRRYWFVAIYRFSSTTVVNMSLSPFKRPKINEMSTASYSSGVSLHWLAMHDLYFICLDVCSLVLFVWWPRTTLYYLSDHREHVSRLTVYGFILLQTSRSSFLIILHSSDKSHCISPSLYENTFPLEEIV